MKFVDSIVPIGNFDRYRIPLEKVLSRSSRNTALLVHGIQLDSGSFAKEEFDLAIEISAFEHTYKFWLTFLEMVCVVRSVGSVHVCIASKGPTPDPRGMLPFVPRCGSA